MAEIIVKRSGILRLIRPDEDPDTSLIGKYTDDCSEWNINRATGNYFHFDIEAAGVDEDGDSLYKYPSKGREFRAFEPYACGEDAGTETYQKYGLNDYTRMEGLNNGEWAFVYCYVEVEVLGQQFRSNGIWGIESDSDSDYVNDIFNEQLSELEDVLEEFNIKVVDDTNEKGGEGDGDGD